MQSLPKRRCKQTIRQVAAVLILFVSTLLVLVYPTAKSYVIPGFAVYLSALWTYPGIWLFAIPAGLPLLDHSSWSGQFFWNLSDTMILATIGVLLLRQSPNISIFNSRNRTLTVAVLLTLCSFFASTVFGMLPIESPDINSFSNYLSRYNSLRILKGVIWAIALQAFVNMGLSPDKKNLYTFLSGVAAGLAGVILVSLWERHVFTGLFDLKSNFRITSTFSSMHIGGGTIEAYLSMVLPLMFSWALIKPNLWKYVVACSFALLGIYVMLVTYSRAGYIALFVTIVTLLVLTSLNSKKMKLGNLVALIACLFFFISVTSGLLKGSLVFKDKFKLFTQDAQTRAMHWKDSLSIMDKDIFHQIFGMGLGSFPRIARERSEVGKLSGQYAYFMENGNVALRLTGGKALFFGQRITLTGQSPYSLSFTMRNTKGRGRIGISLCENNLLQSFDCTQSYAMVELHDGQWNKKSLIFPPLPEKKVNSFFHRPVFFSLYCPDTGSIIDIDDISLKDGTGKELIDNGDFSSINDRWFFISDSHLSWHTKNLPVEIFFEQGLFGLVAFFLFFSAVMYYLYLLGKRSDGLMWAGFTASMIAFIVVGACEGLFEYPQITFFFYFTSFMIFKSIKQDDVNC